jgi:uncharacterized protein
MLINIQSGQAELPAPPIEKQQRLFDQLRALRSVIVAFSGGTDSAYLAWTATQALGEQALSVTAISPSFSAHDRMQALTFATLHRLNYQVIETHEVTNPEYAANQPNRCYHCKVELFEQLVKLRQERGIDAIAYGVNLDDMRDFRPGHRAAAEYGIATPLLDARLTKAEIRSLSRAVGLSTWDRPAAACLSSRIPYGTPVTIDELLRIERAETVLRDLGFRQFRVRAHGDTARIEFDSPELARAQLAPLVETIARGIRNSGFTYVTFDPEGYRQGSLNAALKAK